jgi:F5/8 type C domain
VIATNRGAFQSAREAVREFFLLEKAQEKVTALGASRRDTVRSYYEAAQRRLNVAQDLRGPAQTPAALALYRLGSHFLAVAYLTARGQASIDLASVSVEDTFEALERAFEAEGVNVPPEYSRARPMLVSPDPLDLDRLSAEEAAFRVEELEATSRWLTSLIEARSPSELKWIRFFRATIMVVGTVFLLVMLVLRLVAPKNLALDKPVASSSVGFSTQAAGAVDGSKSGGYGFHSQLEESPWLTIDLGRPCTVSRIEVFGRGDGHYDQSIPLALEVSDDGATYQQIALRSEPFSEAAPWVVKPTALVTRYLRLKTMKQGYLVLGEVEVYGSTSKKK